MERTARCRALLGVAVSAALGACHSFGVTRHTLDVSSGEQRTRIHVWVQEQAPLSDTDPGWAAIPLVILSYPFNALAGIVYGVTAPFDARHDIRFGLLGWVLGVVVPGCTFAGPFKSIGVCDVELDAASYVQFVDALRFGHARAAVRAELRDRWWPIDPDRVVDVAVAPADATVTSTRR